MTETCFDNAAWGEAEPKLSVLIPFKGDDACDLLRALDREEAPAEIVILDDGSNDPALNGRLQAVIAAMRLPARLVRLEKNEGRARGRNRLARHARADALLFLDADMLPDRPDFLRRWIAAGDAPIAFGGFSMDLTPHRRETALNRAMASQTETLSAAQRALAPEKYVYTSNLLVQRHVFETVRFDETFTGYGWEDVEWALRASQSFPIAHIDNSASHLGLDSAATMAAKFEQSAANFARTVQGHRALVETFPIYGAARFLKRLPLRKVWRPIFKATALADPLPVRVRVFAMRLYRAALYAEAV